ncbi:MAG: N-6 DNA methylase [Bryobacterales bacterium]|nr:N-6 DNA methylase [Bryobacterales bacterium]
MSSQNLSWIAGYIWNIADDVLRDVYVRGKYRDVILPMTVLRRLDAVLEGTKQAVLEMKARLDEAGVLEQDAALRGAAGQSFYNSSPFTLHALRARSSRQQLEADFRAYLDGYSPNVQEILDNFEFRNQIPRLSKSDSLGTLIERLTSAEINLGPSPVRDSDGSIRLAGLDNHGMGTIFEELIRRFNEENNEEAGEHWTPRDAVRLMAKLVFLPVASEIRSGTYLLYDGACGTGGMLTVAEETLRDIAAEHGKQVSTHLYGQEINAETYAICKADLLLKGEGEAADNIAGGPERSTLSNDAFPAREFDFMVSNPPYGKSWKTDLERMGGKQGMRDPRFMVEHAGDPEYSLVTRSSDGQLLFLASMLSKMKQGTALGSRVAEVHNGSSLFTGDAGQGESNIRRWILENDWLEAIVALPLNLFYNTGIATYVWVLSNRKAERRKGKVQLIDASEWHKPLRKNMGQKNCELSEGDIARICDAFLTLEESAHSKIFPNEAFGYWKLTVERPLRLAVDLSAGRRAAFRTLCEGSGEQPMAGLVDRLAAKLGAGPHHDFNVLLESLRADAGKRGVRLTAKRNKLLRDALAERSEKAAPVVARKHKQGKAEPDPLRGLREVRIGGKPWVVEYEPDSELRDTEQVPLLEEGGIEGFLRREVLPYAEDAWYVPASVKIGYEISFTRYFYKPQPLRTLAEIRAEILAVERESPGLAGELLGGDSPVAREPLPVGMQAQALPPVTTGKSPAQETKLRVYVDTSVIGGCEDDEFREPSRQLIDRFARGEITLVVSKVTLEELETAPPAVREVFESVRTERLEFVNISEEIRALADRYIESGAIGAAMRNDAEHIAAATLANVDVLASWNFRHIVNLRQIRQYNAVNRQMGYADVEIRDPRELRDEE